jgi:hypothetical protein
MNKKPFLFLLTALALTSCNKTNLLYGANAYNSPVFDKNYYTEWDDIKEIDKKTDKTKIQRYYSSSDFFCSDLTGIGEKIKIGGETITKYNWGGDKEKQFGYNNNLSDIETKFSYGITSKLFDGRVRCEQQYQKSRVQLNDSGFAMYFPKLLVSHKYLGLACRGGTNYYESNKPNFSHPDLEVDLTWSFYIHLTNGEYQKVEYKIVGAKIPVDNNGNTAFINFVPRLGIDELQGAAAMSLTWESHDTRIPSDLTTNYKNKTKKHHLALMLYEVFIGDSVWH